MHARLSGPAVGAAGQPRLLARLRLTLRVMRLRLWWLRLLALLPLLAAHVRHSPGRRCHGLRQRLVFQARVVLVVSRRLLRVRQRSCASHTAFRPGSPRGWERIRPLSSRHAGSLMPGTRIRYIGPHKERQIASISRIWRAPGFLLREISAQDSSNRQNRARTWREKRAGQTIAASKKNAKPYS